MLLRISVIGLFAILPLACRIMNPQYDDELPDNDEGNKSNPEPVGAQDSSTVEDTIRDPDVEDEIGVGSESLQSTEDFGCTRVLCFSSNSDAIYEDDRAVPDGPPLIAQRFVTEAFSTVVGASVLTGEAFGLSAVSLWTDDGSDSPGEMITSGEWAMDETVAWQGTDFDERHDFAEGEVFWLVWKPVAGAQSSLAVEGSSFRNPLSTDDGVSWGNAADVRSMRRIYCCD